MLVIELPGDPISRLETRFNSNTGFAYDPQKHVKQILSFRIKKACNDLKHHEPYLGSVKVEVVLVFSLCEKSSECNLFSWNQLDHTKKVDVDNFAKLLLDCMKGIVYKDDCQINTLTVKKVFGTESKTVITIMPKKEIPEKAKDILALISKKEFINLSEEICIVSDGIEYMCEMEDWVPHPCVEVAYLISKFAAQYASILTKIQKKYPDIYKELEEFRGKKIEPEENDDRDDEEFDD